MTAWTRTTKADTATSHPLNSDLDILVFNEMIVKTNNLVLPHPRINDRAFVLYPIQESTWVGVNNNTDFIKGVTEGVIICEATPIKLGKRSQIWEAKLYNNEVECARSTVRLTNIDRSWKS